MKLMYYSPRQVPEETVIFILSCEIIGLKMNVSFAKLRFERPKAQTPLVWVPHILVLAPWV